MSHDYVSVSLPKSLINRIDEIIRNRDYGYSSRAEFIKEAIRKHLSKLHSFNDISNI